MPATVCIGSRSYVLAVGTCGGVSFSGDEPHFFIWTPSKNKKIRILPLGWGNGSFSRKIFSSRYVVGNLTWVDLAHLNDDLLQVQFGNGMFSIDVYFTLFTTINSKFSCLPFI